MGVGAALLWQSYSALSIHPHYLAYFNEAVGGAEHGLEWLDDSNLDWGQDLIAVREYLEQHPHRKAFVTTMSQVPPSLYGIHAEWVTAGALGENLDPRSPKPGLHIVSAHVSNRIRFWKPDVVDPLHDLEPKAILAHTFYVYEVDRVSDNRLTPPAK